MRRIIEFPSAVGEKVLVEVDFPDDGRGPVRAGRDSEVAEKAQLTFEQAISGLRPIAQAVLAQIEGLGPETATVELGVKFTASAGIVLASSAVEGNCKIVLSWKRGS